RVVSNRVVFLFNNIEGPIRTRTTGYVSGLQFLLLWTAFKTQSTSGPRKNKENQNEEAYIVFLARARRGRHFRHAGSCAQVTEHPDRPSSSNLPARLPSGQLG